MHYKCFVCEEKFSVIKETIQHLKKNHSIKENEEPILCISNQVDCKKYFYSFGGLQNHLKNCVKLLNNVEREVNSWKYE